MICERCDDTGRYVVTGISGNEVDVPCIPCLRDKAAAFDWLAAQELSVEWVGSIKVLYVERQGEDREFHSPTLLDAVQWAMEAEVEGGR